MIIKSMSRKEATFGQLMEYIDRDGGEERYRIRHNLLGRDRERIREEFETNAEHMRKRKNGVFMYHEIISLTRARGLSLDEQKERLHTIAQEYVAARSPGSLCYGGLHDDKDHSIHYHLMMSANRAGEAKRHRLSKAQFRTVQVSLEQYVLQKYPELEQKVAIEKTAEARIPKPEAELKRRGGKATRREEVRSRVADAVKNSRDRDSLFRELETSGFELYVRGKSIGVIDHETGKRHRVKTLDVGLVPALEARMAEMERPKDAQSGRDGKRGGAGEKEKRQEEPKEASPDNTTSKSQSQEKDDNMKRHSGDPIPPDSERQEFIDKGHAQPDPERDLMSHEDWRKQDYFTTKAQQSMRRTMDDFTGRTEELDERAKESPQQQRWKEQAERTERESARDAGRERGDDLERKR